MTDDGTKASGESRSESHGARMTEDLSTYTSMTMDFYRGEIDRMTTWRGRLDQTTNWAVVLVAAILTWAFSSASNPHYVILIGVFGVAAFLVMEANRYREYDVWRDRVRTIQTGLLAEAYAFDSAGDAGSRSGDREGTPASDTGDGWERELSDELRTPEFKMSVPHAINHRLRRSYLALLLILLVAWIARITVFEAGEHWLVTAAILGIPGEAVIGTVAAFYAVVIGIAVWSAREGRTREFQV